MFEGYRLALICNALITPKSTIHTSSTPIPLSTSKCDNGHPFFITLRRDSMATVNGKHLAMKRRPIGIPSMGQTKPDKTFLL